MATTALPVIEIAKNTWEIDEFDCGSIFVLEGEEKAMVIDTGTGIGDLRAVIAGITDKPLVLFVTHAHGDHIGGLGWFDEYYMNEADVGKYAMDGVDFRKHYAKMIADRSGKSYPYDMDADIRPWPAGANPVRHDLVDGQTFDLGGRVVTAMRAPGHTPGSVCLLAEDVMFSGDTLFAGSCGRTDLPGGNASRMKASLARIAALEGDYRVLPGHGGVTTLEHERQNNPYLSL